MKENIYRSIQICKYYLTWNTSVSNTFEIFKLFRCLFKNQIRYSLLINNQIEAVSYGIPLGPSWLCFIVALSYCRHRVIALSPSHFRIVVIALFYCRHRTVAVSP
jgi:hypothetical protein